jgi:hypothetical protein
MAVTGAQIIAEAHKFLGDPYVFGAAGPSTFDCSGLVKYVLEQLGVKSVPRTSEEQWAWVKKIQRSDLQPGDLIFEQWPGDQSPPGHVVIYAGGGKVIEAPHTGADVQLRSWSPDETTITGYGRVPGAALSGGTGGGGGGGGLLSLPASVTGFFGDATQFVQALMWLVNPENWMRILAGVAGVLLGLAGIAFLVKAA